MDNNQVSIFKEQSLLKQWIERISDQHILSQAFIEEL